MLKRVKVARVYAHTSHFHQKTPHVFGYFEHFVFASHNLTNSSDIFVAFGLLFLRMYVVKGKVSGDREILENYLRRMSCFIPIHLISREI